MSPACSCGISKNPITLDLQSKGEIISMQTVNLWEKYLNSRERRIMAGLTSPGKIQDFLDSIPYSAESVYRCPLRVLRERMAHCFDGALFAAAALRQIGHPPLVLDMIPNDRDDDHMLALFKQNGHWGAVAKSNFAGLRFREICVN
jgi:hypothetical protein